jgi:peptide/nickel transport system permease protein
MAIYLLRRLLIGLFTLWIVTILVYGLIRAMPGDPFTLNLESGDKKANMKEFEKAKESLGLNDKIHVGYFKWLNSIGHGDFGTSFTQQKQVAIIVAERIGPTLLLTVPSLFLGYLFAVPLGLYSSAKSGTVRERTLSTILYMLYSLPAFVAAIFLQSLFSVTLRGTVLELPLAGMTSDGFKEMSFLGQTWDLTKHLFLPVLCYTYGVLAYDSRFIQANMAEVTKQDYIRTARAKGVKEFTVYVKHAFRNTLIPFVTLIGLTFPALLSGSVILERIFNWPGMGSQLIESVYTRDYHLIMAIVLLYSIMTLIGQLLADLLYAFADPRITYD